MPAPLPGLRTAKVATPRLTIATLELDRDDRSGPAVLFVHGNVSSSVFWQRTMLDLPAPYRPIAMDLRGFGDTDPEPVDATRGVRDYTDDLAALVDALGLDRVHLVGWSLGGGVVLRYLLGDARASDAWPKIAPGDRGVLNTMAPTHFRIDGLSEVDPKPPVLWIRGADDLIVSDTSLYDFGYLGSIGAVPGWPGPEEWPPQPMIGQTRAVLDGYAAAGGRYREVVLADSGHGPHLDRPAEYLAALVEHLDAAG